MPLISEATGFLASSLVLITFTMKDMRMLRIIGVLSNFAFIAYGLLAWLPPVLALHLLLLPLNVLRLREMSASSAKRPVTDRQSTHARTFALRFSHGRA